MSETRLVQVRQHVRAWAVEQGFWEILFLRTEPPSSMVSIWHLG